MTTAITPKIADCVAETTDTVGVGDINLTGPIIGFTSFSTIGGDCEVYYTIQEGFNKEIGLGNYISSTNTIKRTNVIATIVGSKHSTGGTPLNLKGSAEVFCTIGHNLIEEICEHINGNAVEIIVLKSLVQQITGDLSGYVTKTELLETQHNSLPGREATGAHTASAISASSGNSVEQELLDRATHDELTMAQGAVLGGKLFEGSNGENVENGDFVEAGTTHLRVLVGGKPTIVEMSPVASGVVSGLIDTGATIGSVPVQFSQQSETPYPFADDSVIDIVLVYGQSNARGYAKNTSGDLDYSSPLIKVWDGSTIIPLTSYTPTQNDGTSTGSAWKAFGNEYAKLTGRKAIIANCARGSQSIQDLSKGEANTNYSGLVQWKSDIESYINDIGSSVGKVFVIFHQGERDSQLATTKDDYEALLLQLWADIKLDTGADNMFICTVGTYSSGQQKLDAYPIQAAQRNIGSSNAEIKLAWDEMPGMGDYKVDGVHLNQLGYNYMGEQLARNISSMLFETNVSSPKPALENKGNLLLDGSQSWKVFGGWITKSSGSWVVTNDSSRASCNVISVVDNSDHLLVTLSEQIDYILSFSAAGLFRSQRHTIGCKMDFTAYQDVDSENRTTLKLYLDAPVSLVVDTDAETLSTSLSDANLVNNFSAIFGSGSASITHPATESPAVASCREALDADLVLVSCSSFDTTTTLRLFDPATPTSRKDGAVTVQWSSMNINPSVLSNGTELTFSLVASKKTAF